MFKREIFISFVSLLLLLSLAVNANAKTSTATYLPNQNPHVFQTISHTIPLDVVFVGYNEDVIDMTVLDDTIVKSYDSPWVEWSFNYHIDVNYVFADKPYMESLTLFALENSVIGMDTTSKLNVTALEYQRVTGTRMSVFLPQSGRAIDAIAVENYLATHPYVLPFTPRYTFYVLNFTMFDSADHSIEHWYNLTETDFDANCTRDFWRLEWDNPLNPHVDFPYPAFSYRHTLFFIDPSAFNWYLTWARIWWELDPHITAPKYDYFYEDLDTFQQTHDLSTLEGKTALGYYLGGWIDDILSNTLAPSAGGAPIGSLSLQVLVLNNASEYGYTNDKMQWILNTTLVEEPVEQMAPFIPTGVTVKFANLSEYPDVDALVQSCITNKTSNWTYIDGETLFYGLESLREQHFDYNRAEMTVNGYVFLFKNASMVYYGNEFTGLGGDRQVMLLKSIDRYFRADGVTPKSGLTNYMTHELGHNIAFGHTFAAYDFYYAGDFSYDLMGYYPHSFYFTKLRIDLYRRIYADVTHAELQNALAIDQELYNAQPSSALIDQLFAEIDNRIVHASNLFDMLEYLDALYKLFEAQRIEAYLRELLASIIPLGDINHDGIINITDATNVGTRWMAPEGDPDYDFFSDLYHDGIINLKDATPIGINWMKTGEVKAGFFRWVTGNRTTIFGYRADVWPDWTVVEKNATHGFWNWATESLQCSLRIRNITDIVNIASFCIKIYNQTTIILELTWNSPDPLPDWTSFTVAAQSKYAIHIETTGTSWPPTWFSRISLESRVDSP